VSEQFLYAAHQHMRDHFAPLKFHAVAASCIRIVTNEMEIRCVKSWLFSLATET